VDDAEKTCAAPPVPNETTKKEESLRLNEGGDHDEDDGGDVFDSLFGPSTVRPAAAAPATGTVVPSAPVNIIGVSPIEVVDPAGGVFSSSITTTRTRTPTTARPITGETTPAHNDNTTTLTSMEKNGKNEEEVVGSSVKTKKAQAQEVINLDSSSEDVAVIG